MWVLKIICRFNTPKKNLSILEIMHAWSGVERAVLRVVVGQCVLMDLVHIMYILFGTENQNKYSMHALLEYKQSETNCSTYLFNLAELLISNILGTAIILFFSARLILVFFIGQGLDNVELN